MAQVAFEWRAAPVGCHGPGLHPFLGDSCFNAKYCIIYKKLYDALALLSAPGAPLSRPPCPKLVFSKIFMSIVRGVATLVFDP